MQKRKEHKKLLPRKFIQDIVIAVTENPKTAMREISKEQLHKELIDDVFKRRISKINDPRNFWIKYFSVMRRH